MALAVTIISDTHLPRGRRRLPEACLERLRAADHIVHAGDLIAVEVLEQLRALGPPVTAVHGNVDAPAVRAALPATATVRLEGVELAVLHDSGPAAGRLARLRARFPTASAVVFGHSHIPLLEHDAGFAIFNPGSPTDRRRQPTHTMGLARVSGEAISFELVDLGA
ncbi:MAG TPA: metallophosphoesterase family protein [Solirubrobacteraceae bacterium]|nr:metallophosphoesterase family protein [Solirubrobacteraceae bacterium]